uniref:Uncharacterized protein n=1 Tax=Glossina pallidipes TaxID=7398 RepID=A0A1A9Z7I6_GLOPL
MTFNIAGTPLLKLEEEENRPLTVGGLAEAADIHRSSGCSHDPSEIFISSANLYNGDSILLIIYSKEDTKKLKLLTIAWLRYKDSNENVIPAAREFHFFFDINMKEHEIQHHIIINISISIIITKLQKYHTIVIMLLLYRATRQQQDHQQQQQQRQQQ